MRVLLTNDDGINAEGLLALSKVLERDYELYIVAPKEQKSASSHSITTRAPIFVGETQLQGIKSKAYWVQGTPADCVKISLEKLIDKPIDFVISGINNGYNLGTDVLYSGTVSAAIEGNLFNIPSIAISTDYRSDMNRYLEVAEYAKIVLEKAYAYHQKQHVVLNINVPFLPTEQIKGIKACRIGERRYNNVYLEHKTEDGNIGYMLGGDSIDDQTEDTDTYLIKQGYVTVTPLHYDLTSFKLIEQVKEWF